MARTVHCESGEHHLCIRPSCDCWCEHPHHQVTPRIVVHSRDVSCGTSGRASSAMSEAGGRGARAAQARPDEASVSPPGRRPVPLDIDTIVRCYLDGDSLEQLGRDHQVSRSTIAKRLESAGVRRRAPGTRKRNRHPESAPG